mgnify:CR=1 FL=1
MSHIIRYKSPPTEIPFGLLYRLDKCFSPIFFIHRTLHLGKIYPGKIIKKILLKSENLFFCLLVFSHLRARASIGQQGKTFVYVLCYENPNRTKI